MIETELTSLGHDFWDLRRAHGQRGTELRCEVQQVPYIIHGDYEIRAHRADLHASQCNEAIGHTVIEITGQGVEINFPIPIWDFAMNVGADTFDDERLSGIMCYNDDEDIGGDWAHSPFGPTGDNRPLPEPPHATDMQWFFKRIWRNSFPGFIPKPITRAVVVPKGGGLFIGRIYAQV